MNKIQQFRSLVLGTLAAVSLVWAGAISAQSLPTQLGIAIDNSGSVSNADFQLQVNGLAAALAAVPIDSSVEITVVKFGTSSQVEAGPVLIDSQATIDQLVMDVEAINRSGTGGFTNIGSAISLLTSELNASQNAGGPSVINISTDGNNNTGGNPLSAAVAAQNAGIDALTAEGIGQGVNINQLAQIVFGPNTNPNDGNADILAANATPPNPLGAGVNPWVVSVTDFTAYAGVINSKIQAIVTAPPPPPPPTAVPEPGAIALMGIGILAFVMSQLFSRRRRHDSNQLVAA